MNRDDILNKLGVWAKGKEYAPRSRRRPDRAGASTPTALAESTTSGATAIAGSGLRLALLPEEPLRDPWFSGLLTVTPDSVESDRYFSVGIDAGTSGIRVAAHNEFASTTRLHDFGRNRAGGTRFSFPAVAAYSDGVLLLGNDAVDVPVAQRFTSFKAALIHPALDRAMHAQWEVLSLPGGDVLKFGASASISDFLYSVSIARAAELALPGLLDRTYGVPYVGFSVGAPLLNSVSPNRFERGLSAALLLAGSIGERPSLTSLLQRFLYAWGAAEPLCCAPQDTRRVQARSEAHSTLLPLSRLFVPWRNFLVADIGASTTDVAVVRIGENQKPFCYAAESVPIGVDTLDRAEAEESGSPLNLLAVRQARASGEVMPMKAKAGGEVARQLTASLQRVISHATQKDPDAKAWQEIYLLVVGGGSNIRVLRDAVSAHSPHEWVKAQFVQKVSFDLPEVRGSTSDSPQDTELFELVSVLGAAVPGWAAGEYATQDQVRPAPPAPRAPERDPQSRPRWV